jgi:c(7)-type cytochrome triheme protein
MRSGPRWRQGTVCAWCAAAIAAALLVACTTANPVMTFFFDGVAAPGEVRVAADVVKQPRRPPYKPPPPRVTFEAVPDLPPAVDWAGIYKGLPRNESDAVLWVKALDEKLITPRPGLAPDAKDEEPTDMDVELVSSGQPEYKVVFRHKPHGQWMGCPACHAGLFEMEKGKAKLTMADMANGKQCGACHGKVAAPDLSACTDCHPPGKK